MNHPDVSLKKLRKVRTYAEDLEIGKRQRDQKDGVVTHDNEAIKLPEVKVEVPDKSVVEKKTVDLKHVVANIKKPKAENLVSSETKPPKIENLIVADETIGNKSRVMEIDQKTLDKFAPVKKSLVDTKKDNEFVIDSGNDDGATIITDNKKDRFQFFPAIKKALSEWFLDYKEEQRQKKIPKYVVPDAEMRKGVIQKATSSTGRFATSDFSNIQDRIRQREEYEKRTEHITWSPNTEAGYPLLPGQVDNTSNVQLIRRRSYEVPAPAKVTPVTNLGTRGKNEIKLELPIIAPEPKAKLEPTPLPPKPPTIPSTPAKPLVTPKVEAPFTFTYRAEKTAMPKVKTPEVSSDEEIHLPEIEKVKKVEEKKVATPAPKEVKRVVEAEPSEELKTDDFFQETEERAVPEDRATWNEEEMEDYSYEDWQEEESAPVERKPAQILRRARRPFKLSDLTTNTMTVGIVAVIAFIGVIILVATYMAGDENKTEQTDPVAEERIKALLLPNLPVDFVVLEPVSSEEVQKALLAITGETKALVFVKPGPAKEPVANTGLLSLLTDSNNAGILATLKQIYLGRTDLNEPFVLIKITDEVSAKGGMLSWEKTLYQDFQATFALTATNTPSKYTDKTTDDTDVRILVDKANNELLTYGLINNMIIITTDSVSFGELVSLIK